MPDTVHSPVTQRAIPRRVASTGGFTIFRFDHAEEHEVSDLEAVVGRNFTNPAADGVQIVPAATVILVRDGIEVLMLRRDSKLEFAGGMWVFPGGRIDDDDWQAPEPSSTEPDAAIEAAARRAAVREAMEEAGIAVIEPSLRRWSHWTPPQFSDHRFTTAFFVAPADDASAEIIVDDGEIREHRWATPAQVVSMRDTGEIELAPPTFITLRQLMQHAEVASVLDAATQREQARTIEHFATRVVTHDGGWTAVYHGDTLYEYAGGHGATSAGLSSAPGEVTALDLEAAGPRHRLLMAEQWSYIRQGC